VGRDDLASVGRLIVTSDVVLATWKVLTQFGAIGCEGLVLWTGSVMDQVAHVSDVLVPDQVPIRDEDGVGYFVPGEALAKLNRELYARGVRLLAQLHSHPGEAYHSTTDDRYAIVTEEGGFSVVVPSFGRHPPFEQCAIYRLERGRWTDQTARSGIISTR